jgi:predicted dehydrogenase
MTASYDIVIAGGGINGLACGTVLARAGLTVCVLEQAPWVGGGAVTREVTLPGFKHDLYGSSHVWIHCNPDFAEIKEELKKFGLEYIWSEDRITGHPDSGGGPGIIIHRSIDKTVASIARYSEKDAQAYRRIHDDFYLIREGFLKAFFSPPAPPSVTAQAMERSREGLRRLREFSLSARAWVEQHFGNDFVRAVMLNWALAPQILPEQEGAGQSFYIMIPAVHVYGQSIPRGGSQQLPLAMARYIEAHGGTVFTNCPVRSLTVASGEARGAVLADGRAAHASYTELARDGSVDIIYIATPPAEHHAHIALCLQNGKSVLCEKPFTTDAGQAHEVIELARDRGLFLMEAMWTRFLPACAALRRLIGNGAIGRPQLLIGGGAFVPAYDPDHYLFSPRLGGGVLLDAGVYLISLASMLLGPIRRVHASGDLGVHGVDEHDCFILDHDGGARALLYVSLRARRAPDLELLGDAGRIQIGAPVFRPTRLVLSRPAHEDEILDLPAEGSGYGYEIMAAMDAVREGHMETDVMALDETLSIMVAMDEIGRQVAHPDTAVGSAAQSR